MMTDYPQVMSTKKLEDILRSIPDIGVPSQVDNKWLKENSLTSSHDLKLLAPLKFIGFIENKSRNAAPTERWQQARGDLKGSIARGVREGYSELFSKFPDAHLRDGEQLVNFFKANTTQSAEAAKRMSETFSTLCSMADFDRDQPPDNGSASSTSGQEDANTPKLGEEANNTSIHLPVRGTTVALNIELHVPADLTGEVYEKFFKSMREHLIDGFE